MTYSFSPDEPLSQGDILRHVKVIVNVRDGETNSPKYDLSNIIVLSRNCEIDKPVDASTNTNSVSVARVIRLSSLHSSSLQGNIKNKNVINTHFLAADGEIGLFNFWSINVCGNWKITPYSLHCFRSG